MKTILSIYALAIFTLGLSQTTVFTENFEDDSPTVFQWQYLDLDGDGFTWERVYSSDQAEGQGWGPDFTNILGSFAYNLFPGQEAPLTPDNVAISPVISIPQEDTTLLNFKIGTNYDQLNNHNVAIYILEENAEFSTDLTPFYTRNFAGISTAQDESLDITEFAGNNIQIYIRHYDSDAQFVLLFDDVEIINGVMSTNETTTKSTFNIYPNPAKDIVQIQTTLNDYSIEIYDMHGKLIHTFSNLSQINVSNLEKGIYMIQLKTDKEVWTKKLIKK